MSETDIIQTINREIIPFCALLILFVCVQAILFMRHALRFNHKYQLFSKQEIASAMRSSAVITIGPAFSVMLVVVSLIPLLGSVVTFMRCGVIGAADYELMNAQIAAQALGMSFEDHDLTAAAFTVAIFGCTLASAPWFIHTIISCKAMDKMAIKSAHKKRSFMPVLGTAASLGFIGYWAIDTGRKSVANTVSIVASLLVSFAVAKIAKKVPKIADWSMAIAMVLGMIVGAVVNIITAG